MTALLRAFLILIPVVLRAHLCPGQLPETDNQVLSRPALNGNLESVGDTTTFSGQQASIYGETSPTCSRDECYGANGDWLSSDGDWSPVFQLCCGRIDCEQFISMPRLDPCARREWFFKNCFTGKQHCELSEYDQRLLSEYFYRERWLWAGDLLSDAEYYYAPDSLLQIGGFLLISAPLANTAADENFRQWLMRQKATEPCVGCGVDEIGNGYYTVPIVFGVGVLARAWRGYRCQRGFSSPVATRVQKWSYRSMRAYFVGAPSLLFLQYLTGASRPGESSAGSDWKPFNDNNGASGHAFVGAVPFLMASRMAERPLVKTAFFVGSGLAGYGRLCRDRHYLSQVILGWGLAYLSVQAVDRTNCAPTRYRLVPLDLQGSAGLAVEVRR